MQDILCKHPSKLYLHATYRCYQAICLCKLAIKYATLTSILIDSLFGVLRCISILTVIYLRNALYSVSLSDLLHVCIVVTGESVYLR